MVSPAVTADAPSKTMASCVVVLTATGLDQLVLTSLPTPITES